MRKVQGGGISQKRAIRKLAILAAFLAILLAGCSSTTQKSPQPEETTADTATGATRPETTHSGSTRPRTTRSETTRSGTTAGTSTIPEETTSATVAPAGWVTAFGDSVMLGAVDALLQKIPDLALIDAQGSRQFLAAADILRQHAAAGHLGDAVVIHIGNNGPFTAEQFDEMMKSLAGVRKILIVNLTIPAGVEDPIAVPNNAMLAAGAQRYPNTVLVDWHAASAGHPEYFAEDGIHLTLQGAQAYADLIAAYLGDSAEDSGALPGPQERTYRGEDGFFGECVGPPSWCAITPTP